MEVKDPKDELNSENYSFINEKIKERPINKKKLIKKTVITVSMAMVFGMVACVTFLVLEPVISNWHNPEVIPKVEFPDEEEETLPEEMLTEEQNQQEIVEQVVEKVELPTQENFNEVLTIDTYQALYEKLYQRTEESKGFMATVTGVTQDVDWFQNTVENENSTAGIVIADNSVEILVLAYIANLGEADSYKITLVGDEVAEATLKMSDVTTGLGVFAVKRETLSQVCVDCIQIATLGNSNAATIIGRPILAIGRPIGQNGSVCYGAVTSTGTTLDYSDATFHVLTTDMYGNEKSSGVLITTTGEVVGIITDYALSVTEGNVICAVGVSELREYIEKMSNGEAVPYLGVHGMDVTEKAHTELGVPYGAYITAINPESPAMTAGIMNGNVITKINDTEITDYEDYKKAILLLKPEQIVKVTIMQAIGDEYKSVVVEVNVGSAK